MSYLQEYSKKIIDMTANYYKKCGNRYHGVCVSLKIDRVKWLGTSTNCVRLCHICISSNILTLAAKLTSLNESFENKVSTGLEYAIPKAIEKFAEMETNLVFREIFLRKCCADLG